MRSRKPVFIALVVSCGLLGIVINHYLGSSAQQTNVAEDVGQPAANQKVANESGFSQTVESSNKNKKAVATKKVSENYNYIQERLDIMRERRPNDVYDEKAVAEAVARTDAWA